MLKGAHVPDITNFYWPGSVKAYMIQLPQSPCDMQLFGPN